MASKTTRSTADVMKKLGVAVGHDYCYCKLRYNGTEVEIRDNFTEHCHGSTGKTVMMR